MDDVKQKIKLLLHDGELKNKFIFTLSMLFVFRLFAFLPVPAIDADKLREFFSQSQFFTLLDVSSGGTLLNFSVMALGINPYINSSIIIQMFTMVFPKLEALSNEGDYGRYKLNQYTRFLTVPLTVIQAVGIYMLLKNQQVIGQLSVLEFFSFILTLVCGTFILMWIGELVTEYGIGNGISLIIFAGIVGRMPTVLWEMITTFDQEKIFGIIMLLMVSVGVIASVVFINQAIRRIPVYYAKRIKGNKMYQGATNYLPLKLNQAGVIPIIFAVSFVLLPQFVGNFLRVSPNQTIASLAGAVADIFNPSGIIYNISYFLLVVVFTLFYTMLVFNPKKISEDIQRHGGFIPGIRPGESTRKYLEGVLYKITSVGALFLGFIAIMPAIASYLTGISSLIIGGASILIVVSVVLETFKAVEAQLIMKSYDRYSR